MRRHELYADVLNCVQGVERQGYTVLGTAISVDVPVIKEIVGGTVSVKPENEKSTTVSYEGDKALAFGFAAIEFSAGERTGDKEFDLIFTPVTAGDASFALEGSSRGPSYFKSESALSGLPIVDAEALGN